MLRTPRTDPGGRDSRTGLPPRVFDGEASSGPWMKDAGWGQELCREFGHPVPCGAISLASLYKRTSPDIGHIVPEGSKASAICGDRMIREVSTDNLSKPLTLKRDGFVHAPSQLLFDHSQPRPHPVPARLPLELEGAPAGPAADVSETKKVERLRLAQPTVLSIFGREATKLDQPGLFRMQRKRELLQPLPHVLHESLRFSLMLEAHDDVIGVPHNDDLTLDMVLTPVIGPEVERIVKIDVGQQGRDDCSLRSARLGWCKVSIFHDARLQPLANQTEDAPVANPVFDEPNQPLMTDGVEGNHDTLPIISTFPRESPSSVLAIRLKASRSAFLGRRIAGVDCISF